MSKRPKLNLSSAPPLPTDNHVNDTETHSELLALCLELATCPLSAHAYRDQHTVPTPFALRISSDTRIGQRPRENSTHRCIETIAGQTIPYGNQPKSYYIEAVTVNLDQYTVWAYDIATRDFVLGDIIHVCRQFHYNLSDLQLLAQSIRRHSLSLTSPVTPSSWSTTTHLTLTCRLPTTPIQSYLNLPAAAITPPQNLNTSRGPRGQHNHFDTSCNTTRLTATHTDSSMFLSPTTPR